MGTEYKAVSFSHNVLVVIAILIVTLQNSCSLELSANKAQELGDVFDGSVEVPSGAQFGIELVSPADQAINLGASKPVTFAIQGAADLIGSIVVNLSIARTEMDAVLAVPSEIGTPLSVSSVTLSAGSQSVQTVNLTTNTHAPSGFIEHFHIEATSPGTAAELSVNLSVNPVFVLTQNNVGTPASWTGIAAGQQALFRAHAAGLRVDLVNNTGVLVWNHADDVPGIGGCNHQSTNGQNSGIPNGGVYSLTITSAQANLTCKVYRHGSGPNGFNAPDNEGAGNGRTIVYNAP